MANFARPGVYIQEVALQQSVQPANTANAVGAFVGALPKGKTTAPVLVSTWTDFVKAFGGLNDSYPTTWAAYNFFANGGRNLYVKRVLGASSATGSLVINDGPGTTTTTTATVTAASAASGTITYTATNTFTVGQTVTITGLSTSAFNLSAVTIASRSGSQFTVTSAATGTAVTGASATATVTVTVAPSPVFTVTAVNPGAWSSEYSVVITAAGSNTRFGLEVYQTITVSGSTSTSLVESYTDLSMSSTDRNFVRSVINSNSASVITIGTVGFDATKLPGTTVGLSGLLAGGADGQTPVRADYAASWTTFDSVINPLVMYAPDAPYAATSTLTSQIHGDTVAYAATRTDAFAVIDTPSGLSTAAAQESVTATYAIFAASTTGNIAAAYYPWYSIPDPTKSIGVTRLQAPGAGVVGQYLATDASRGPAKTPAGLQNVMALAVSTEHLFTNAELDSINTSVDPINAIRQVPGAGIVIMGGRTFDNTPNNRYINLRRSLIYIEKSMNDLTSFALFENNDSNLWSQINTSLNSFLRSYWQSGGLRGTNPSQAFYVLCDATNNSFTEIQAGRVNIEVGVALEYPAEFVVIKLGQLTGNASA
jgi:phage tail sheath protein FI